MDNLYTFNFFVSRYVHTCEFVQVLCCVVARGGALHDATDRP